MIISCNSMSGRDFVLTISDIRLTANAQRSDSAQRLSVLKTLISLVSNDFAITVYNLD